MYKIEPEPWGFRLTFWGDVTVKETWQWLKESMEVMEKHPAGTFSAYIDMSKCNSIPNEAQGVIEQVQELFMEKGLERSVVVIQQLESKMQPQIKMAALETGAYLKGRYIDIKTTPDWEKKAMDWILNAIEPYARRVPNSA